ncbi:MAG TPA: TetR/AcrR family transcriptional regulator C-terminal domain-containing protein [Methanomassiliicoccales archaeon]
MRERSNPKAPHLEPEAVVRAGLEILDEEGLERVTLRQIASRLGVQAPALYWHFRDKSDIIDDMAQAILKDCGFEDLTAPPDKDAWAEWLAVTAHSLRQAMLSHREGARIVAGATFRSKAMVRLKTISTQVLNDAGFDLLHASLASETVINYVWGYVIEEQSQPPEPGSGLEQEEIIESKSEQFPEWKMIGEVIDQRKKMTAEELFDWGLYVIIEGLRISLNRSGFSTNR